MLCVELGAYFGKRFCTMLMCICSRKAHHTMGQSYSVGLCLRVSACRIFADNSLLFAFNIDNAAGSIWSHCTHNIDTIHPVSWWETVLSFLQGCSWRWSLSTGFSISEEACNWFTEEVCTPEALKGLYKRWQMYVAKQKISRDRADELLEMASHVYGCLKTV